MRSLWDVNSLFNMLAYILCLFGAAFAGFPPPRSFQREETPEDVLIHLLDDEFDGDHDSVLSEWGFRVSSPVLDETRARPKRTEPPRGRRPTLTREPRPPARRARTLKTG